METKFDIVIIGGGIAGCISAMFLHQKHSICIIDKPKEKNCAYGESLIASSKRIFRELDILERIESLDESVVIPAIGMKSYWGSVDPQYTDSIRNPDGEGLIINKSLFNDELRQITKSFGCYFVNGHIQNVIRKSKEWEIDMHLVNDKKITLNARFIIDASGRTNILRRKLLLKKDKIDKLTCYTAIVENRSKVHLSSIVPDHLGWWYSSPLHNNKRLISYYTDADLWDKKITKGSDFIGGLLESNRMLMCQLSVDDLVDYKYIGIKAASTSKLETVSGNGWVAIGDAAICLDPLSSRGLYNAMVMAAQTSKLMNVTAIVFNRTLEHDLFFHQEVQGYADRIFNAFQREQRDFYAMECRWHDSPFWKRRQSVRKDKA